VQWGIPGDPEKTAEWDKRTLMDEPVKTSNVRGTLTYAKSQAPNSRSNQVFINYGDNSNLDELGFSPIGKVVKGMDVVEKINSQYGQEPDQSQIESRGNAYLKEEYPKLDYIKEAKMLGAVATAAADAPTKEAAAPASQPAVTTAN
jgi:peptidyl-prolyl cis-trans isomerase A (cyclophilin A)